MKYTVDYRSLRRSVQNIQDKSDNALLKSWEYLAGKIQEQLKQDSYDLWTLAGSVESQLVKHGLVEVGSALEYAPVMEYGRKPWKFPPLDALVGWTSRKKIISKWNATKSYNDLHYKDKWKVFVIARWIARKWIEGKHTFENVLNRERLNIQKIYIENMQQW